jgi:hypothetical protein
VHRLALILLPAALLAAGPFEWKAAEGRRTLYENGKPVFAYNEAPQLAPGAPAGSRRCCYIYPAYTPAGVVVLDDFPVDHFHHRGLFWGWPGVRTAAGNYDLWVGRGIGHENVSVSTRGATLDAVNVWVAGGRRIVEENVSITAHPAQGPSRDIDVVLTLKALEGEVTLGGSTEKGKSYGGFNARFAPRAETKLRTDTGPLAKDEDLVNHAWAELEAVYQGKRAALRITSHPDNPGGPPQWCLRHYGFVGASFPGRSDAVQSYTLKPGQPLTLRYRVTLTDLP